MKRKLTLTKQLAYITSLTLLCGVYSLNAQEADYTARHANIPVVTGITSTTATFDIPQGTQVGMMADDRSRTYFEYYKTNQVCIAIYPTPEYCLPKKTQPGTFPVTVNNLAPNTEYSVVYKRDNTIRCITAPCPDNSYTSLIAQFRTSGNNGDTSQSLSSNLRYRSRGAQVVVLQNILIQRGFMFGNATGYFGIATHKAVKGFQRSVGISPTGYVGPLTRAALNGLNINTSVTTEQFEGTITAVSTGCFSDGECSISVDGKKVITTLGWTGGALGSIRGTVQSVGEAETKIGHTAKVFAKKINGGYTLYGSTEYYIEVQ